MLYFKLLFFLVFLIIVFSFFSLAPWVPTRKNDLKRIFDIVSLKEWEHFLEMWVWTAKVSLYMAKNNPKSFVTWIELSPFFYILSKIKVYLSWVKNIEIKYWNALNLDLKKYDVIYVFWLPETITKKIFPKIKGIENKNFRFISYCFKMNNDYFVEKIFKEEGKNAIYEYKKDK